MGIKIFSKPSSFPIFENFTPQEIEDIELLCETQDFDPQVDIIKEGEMSDDFFVILRGKVEVLKIDENHHHVQQFRLTTFSIGDVIGEMAFIDHAPRSSTVRTMEATTLIRISSQSLAVSKHYKSIRNKLIRNIAKMSSQRLREANSQYVNSLQTKLNLVQKRRNFGTFFICIFVSLSIATISEYIIEFFHYDVRSDVSTVVRVIFVCLPNIYFIAKFKSPLKDFGVTWEGWEKSVLEGSLFGVGITGIGLFIDSLYSAVSFKNEILQLIHSFKGGYWLIIYPLLSYLQEFIVRGVVQSSAQKLLNDDQGFYAVFVTAVLFAGVHIHRGWQFVFLAFFASMVMGVIYLHRQNLIGVTIIHMIAGFVLLPITEKY